MIHIGDRITQLLHMFGVGGIALINACRQDLIKLLLLSLKNSFRSYKGD